MREAVPQRKTARRISVSADTEKHLPSMIPVSSGTAVGVSNGECFTIQEIAARWKLSPDKVRRIFAQEEGVLVFHNEPRCGNRRRYSTLRIPRGVLLRVQQKYSLTGQLIAKDR